MLPLTSATVRWQVLQANKIDGISAVYRRVNPILDTVMQLTDLKVRAAKPKALPYKLSDGGGMYLLVTPAGARYWRLDYRFVGKRRTLALGVYPAVTLSNARAHREEAKTLLARDIDPGTIRRAGRRAAKLAS
jgi:hypothetical protein